jgi:hypothetical protein
MRSAIFSLLPVRRGSTIASVRIGLWLSELLDLPLYDDDSILTEGPWDHLFIINGSTLYCKCLPAIADAVCAAGDVYWVQNDYTLPPPAPVSNAESPFRRAFRDRALIPHYWTTCQSNAARTAKSTYLNWNCLGYAHAAPRAVLRSPVGVYYGAYRDNRARAFEAMYDMFLPQQLRISSTSKKFRPEYVIPPFRDDIYGCLANYGWGIYAQDVKSAAGGHSPATRFYEMLSVGLPIFFMPGCVPTMASYGYNVSEYVLTPVTADRLIEDRRMVSQEQRDWVKPFPIHLAASVREAYARATSS